MNGKRPSELSVRNLELSRGGRRVCVGLTFTLGAGERLEITGANGAGKTSLLRVLAGVSSDYAGDVAWRGDGLTYVGHKTGFKAELSAWENLRLYAGLKSSAATDDAVGNALERFGLAGFADVPCGALSEGQRRRAALARLPVEGAALWLLDEPTAALDREGCSTLEALLAEHAARGGITVVATHRMSDGADGAHGIELPFGGGGRC